MSIKNRARYLAKQVVGNLARVDKIEGRLHITRINSDKILPWRKEVKKLVLPILPNWQITKIQGEVIILEYGRKKSHATI